VEGVSQVVTQGDVLPAFDVHTPLMSLPLALGTDWTFGSGRPYLGADPADERRWARRLAGSAGLRVGLVWAGAPRLDQPTAAAVDRRRSMPLPTLAPLAAIPDVTFYSLQKGRAAEQGATLAWPGGPMVDHAAELSDFAQTAALVANLDLVISVDTAVAHLAGALGKPVWVLSRFDGCWRWRDGWEHSPWYPSARLFWQTTAGDWEGVIGRVAAALAVAAREGSAAGPGPTAGVA
jgi:hypothetical protein